MSGLWPIAGALSLVFVTSALGFAETVLAQVGVNRLRSLLAGENGAEDFSADEESKLLAAFVLLRLLAVLLSGGLVMFWSSYTWSEPWAEVCSLLLAGLVLLIFDTVARRHARAKAHLAAGRVLTVFRRLYFVLYPLVATVFWCASLFSPKGEEAPVASLDGLQEEILTLRTQGLLKETQTELIQSLLEFGDTIAREVMVPRVDMVCAQLGTSTRNILTLMREHGVSRIPIYKESIDDILGFVHVKDLLADLDGRERRIAEVDLRRVFIVPGTNKVIEILRDLQAQKAAMAIVLDEYGGTDGLLTVEDIVEEIVGEINDEYDEEAADLKKMEDGTALVDAKMIVEDVNENLDLELPTEGPETLGGYLYELFGHAPEMGETVMVDSVRFTIVSVKRNRITWVKIERLDESGEEEGVENERVA